MNERLAPADLIAWARNAVEKRPIGNLYVGRVEMAQDIIAAYEFGLRSSTPERSPTEPGWQPISSAPIPMVLFCPACGLQHIDAPDADSHAHSDGRESRWDNPPHRSHLCHGCGHIWRPADVPTEGVTQIQTRGKADSASPASPAHAELSPGNSSDLRGEEG